MSTEPRGRHRAARHAAPKKKVVAGKQIGSCFWLSWNKFSGFDLGINRWWHSPSWRLECG